MWICTKRNPQVEKAAAAVTCPFTEAGLEYVPPKEYSPGMMRDQQRMVDQE